MIEFIEGFPEGAVAVAGKGRVTAEDYDKVLIPKIEETLKRYGKLSLYCELGEEFAGIDAAAAWKDFKIGVAHLSRWERMAVVTDIEWIRFAINAFRFLMLGRLRLFPTAKASEARAWIGAAKPPA